MKKTVILQHSLMEVPGTTTLWCEQKHRPYQVVKIFAGESLPAIGTFDDLIVLGGPMNVDQESQYPWLKTEKMFIQKFLSTEGRYVGLCLGGQLLARVLGSPVKRNPQQEIGWHPIHKISHKIVGFHDWPTQSQVFQWHQDTFDIPPGCENLFRSEACENQAFAFNRKAVGFQFHPESTMEWINDCYADYDPQKYIGEKYVQTPQEAKANSAHLLLPMQKNFFRFLDLFLAP